MIEFGATLRRAREAKGLTTNDLAQQTHLMVQQIEALEREDFSKIAAPIYGRGFVKLYCEAVGLEVKPMVTEFMELFSGNRAVVINKKERAPKVEEKPAPTLPPPIDDIPFQPPAEDLPPSDEEPTADPIDEPPSFADDLFASSEPQSIPAPKPQPKPTPPPKTVSGATGKPATSWPPAFESHGPSRYTKPQPIDRDDRFRFGGFSLPAIPRAVWRMLALGAVALVILWLLFAGIRALYRATMSGDPEQTAPTATEETAAPAATETDAAAQPATPPKSDRSTRTIPLLYID